MQVQPSVAAIGTGAASQEIPRLGQISFINCLPVALPIDWGYVPVSAQVFYGSPSELNARMADGALDIGAMSSFFFLQHGGLDLVRGLSISCDGAVGSVLFFSKLPLNQLAGKRIAVPASSATSVNLLRVLLLDQMNIPVEVVVQSEPSPEEPGVQGALVIGDLALRMDVEWSLKYRRIDLGQWWLSRTGLPMVFGLWAARSDWASQHREQFEAVSEALVHSVEAGLGALLPAVVSEAKDRTALDELRLQRYFQQQLNYELAPRHMAGLEHFNKLCHGYKLL